MTFQPHEAVNTMPPVVETVVPWTILVILLVITVWAFGLRTTRATKLRDREDARAHRHKRRSAWIRFARQRHLQLWRSRSGPTYVLRGVREEVPLTIDLYLSERPATVCIRARALEPRPVAVRAWRPETSTNGAGPPERDAALGDPSFDEAYQVKVEQKRDALAVLHPRVRSALLEVPRVTRFEYDQGEVLLEWEGADATVADAAIEAVVAACTGHLTAR